VACTQAGSPHGRPRETHRRTPASSASDKRAFTSRNQLAGSLHGPAVEEGQEDFQTKSGPQDPIAAHLLCFKSPIFV